MNEIEEKIKNQINSFIEVVVKELYPDKILEIKIGGFRNKSGALAFYELGNTIYISRNENAFSSFEDFIITLLHEKVHEINFLSDVTDVEFRGNYQLHNEEFDRTFKSVFNLYTNNTTHEGGVDIYKKINQEMYDKMTKLKVKKDIYKRFLVIKEGFLTQVYNPLKEGSKYKDNNKKYEIDDEGGEEI